MEFHLERTPKNYWLNNAPYHLLLEKPVHLAALSAAGLRVSLGVSWFGRCGPEKGWVWRYGVHKRETGLLVAILMSETLTNWGCWLNKVQNKIGSKILTRQRIFGH